MQLTRDAAEEFTAIVESGQEIPYEVGEPGQGLAFCQYRPLTARFIRDNATELRGLVSFREATETMRRSELAGPYLEDAGIVPSSDPQERSNLAVTYFLARMWDGCSEFEVDEDRFAAAVGEIEECAEPEAGEVEAIVPLVGFAMDATSVRLQGVSIVRADTVDVPPEATTGERANGTWEPSFLISARVSLDEDGGLGGAGERVATTFERVVTTLRLFKSGGVALGPHGWVRVAGDRWRRISTGAGRPRPGGYRLSEEELEPLEDLARTIAVHPRRVSRLRRGLLRFEAGLDRRGAIDALNDHLLSLRFLLEGEGPAGVGLPMRVAALVGEGDDRPQIRVTVERAIALERELWSGDPSSGVDGATPPEIAAGLEDVLRAVLCRALAGDLGGDLRAAADETLLADGLAIGEGSEADRGSTTEWDLEPVEVDATEAEELAEIDPIEAFEADPEPEILVSRGTPEPELADDDGPARMLFDDEAEIRAERRAPEPVVQPAEPDPVEAEAPVERHEKQAPVAGWLDEVAGDETMDFPARSQHLRDLARPPMDRDEVKARVEYLFPRTETDWTVEVKDRDRAATG
jgi:hypothetical protein